MYIKFWMPWSGQGGIYPKEFDRNFGEIVKKEEKEKKGKKKEKKE